MLLAASQYGGQPAIHCTTWWSSLRLWVCRKLEEGACMLARACTTHRHCCIGYDLHTYNPGTHLCTHTCANLHANPLPSIRLARCHFKLCGVFDQASLWVPLLLGITSESLMCCTNDCFKLSLHTCAQSISKCCFRSGSCPVLWPAWLFLSCSSI